MVENTREGDASILEFWFDELNGLAEAVEDEQWLAEIHPNGVTTIENKDGNFVGLLVDEQSARFIVQAAKKFGTVLWLASNMAVILDEVMPQVDEDIQDSIASLLSSWENVAE
mgnify:FL=1